MTSETLIPLFDLVGTAGFLAALVLGVQNYRETDLFRPFWLAFSVTAALGAVWLGLVTLEWLNLSSDLLDVFSTSLQAVVIGLYAIGVIGLYTVVVDLERTRQETAHRASIISILSRVLRHNLRNDLNVIRGYTSLLSDGGEAVENIQKTVDELMGTTEKARKLERTVTSQPRYLDIDLTDLLGRVVADVRDSHPAATISLSGATDATITGMASLETAFRELIENAAVHAGAEPSIEIRVEKRGSTVAVHVRDEGPGLPESEQAVLESGVETPLFHSDGLGLWIATWIVRSHDGEIEARTTDIGTTITVDLPRTPPRQRSERARRLQHTTRGYDRYHAIFENHVDGILVVDDDLRILDANDRAVDLLSQSTAGLPGRHLGDLVPDAATLDPDWEDLEPGTVQTGTVVFSSTGAGDLTCVYTARANIVSGEHLLTFRVA